MVFPRCYTTLPHCTSVQGWILVAQNLFFPGQWEKLFFPGFGRYLLPKTGENLIYFMMLHLGDEYLITIKRQHTIYIKKNLFLSIQAEAHHVKYEITQIFF